MKSALSLLTLVVGLSSAAMAADLEKGKATYNINCAMCHGEKGDANSPAGQALNPKPRNFLADNFKAGDSEDQIFQTITKGLPGTAMVAFAQIPEPDRKNLAAYVSSLRKAAKGGAAKPAAKKK